MNNTINLAIADDHVMIREALVRMLTNEYSNFHFSIQASNGKELLEKITASDVLPDVVLLDVSMPVMNGYETIKAIRRQWKKLKVLAISMYQDEFAIINMLVNGANGFISKDQAPNELSNAIVQVYKNGRYYSDRDIEYTYRDSDALKSLIPKITDKEMKFLSLCVQDKSYMEISIELGLSIRTVQSYRDNLFKKLNVSSRIGLVIFAIISGLVPNIDRCK